MSANTIAALKENNEMVFNEVFKEYHQRVYFYVLEKTKSTYLAEEVVQVTFIKLWQNRSRLDEYIKLSTQIFQIAKTSSIDLLRSEGRKQKLSVTIEEKKSETPAEGIPDNIEGREMERRLAQAIQELPPMRRRVFELSRYELKSHKEISRILLLSEKTVENHIALAIKQLRRLFFLLIVFFLQ